MFFNRLISLLVLILFSGTALAQTKKVSNPEAQKIESLIKKMTIEEKVGQMTQLTLSVFYKNGVLQEDKLKEYLTKYSIGSLLNVDKSIPFSIYQNPTQIRGDQNG